MSGVGLNMTYWEISVPMKDIRMDGEVRDETKTISKNWNIGPC
jgi:hypothetical protein